MTMENLPLFVIVFYLMNLYFSIINKIRKSKPACLSHLCPIHSFMGFLRRLRFPGTTPLHRGGALRTIPLALGRLRDADTRIMEPLERTLEMKEIFFKPKSFHPIVCAGFSPALFLPLRCHKQPCPRTKPDCKCSSAARSDQMSTRPSFAPPSVRHHSSRLMTTPRWAAATRNSASMTSRTMQMTTTIVSWIKHTDI